MHELTQLMRSKIDVRGKEATQEKWGRKLLPWVAVVMGIARQPRALESLFSMMEMAHLYTKGDKGNSTPDLMVNLGDGEYFPMCINSMAQLLGILAGRDIIHAFLQAFLVNDQVSLADHLQKYVCLLVMPKVPKRAIFWACLQSASKRKADCWILALLAIGLWMTK
jgi:hypothetical protein